MAPIYGSKVEDDALLHLIAERDPRHLVLGLAGGVQEKLGAFLRQGAGGKITVHCIGGALGVLTGDQVSIPNWADRLYLGWFFRLLDQPGVFIPRLWRARILPWLMLRYGAALPPLSLDD